MKHPFLPTLLGVLLATGTLSAQNAEFIPVAQVDPASLKTENDASVAVTEDSGQKAIRLSFPSSQSYPGVDFVAPDGAWNLSAFNAVAVEVTNESPIKIGVAVRVENPGDWRQSPWNSEVVWLAPGSTGTVTVTFGQTFGKPGFALDPANVNKLKVFVNPAAEAGSIVINQIRAMGTAATSLNHADVTHLAGR